MLSVSFLSISGIDSSIIQIAAAEIEKILAQSCQRHEIQLANVTGFGDTLAVFRREYPGGAGGYSQSALVRDILGSVYDEHNAVADVRSLLGSVGLF